MWVMWQKFDFDLIKRAPLQKRKQRRSKFNRLQYKDLICALDVETSKIQVEGIKNPQSFIYIWQVQIEDYTIFGRTADELQIFLYMCSQQVNDGCSLVFFVHNLSYEWQFLRDGYRFQNDELFIMDSRKIARASMWDNKIELRCSAIHSNMSLKQYLKKMNVDAQKLDGDEFNYSEIRYPWTQLTRRELEYCEHDVLGLVQAIKREMQMFGDQLDSFPMTAVGYVRRDAKSVLEQYRLKIRDLQPNIYVYHRLREAFRGGNTHANRYYAGHVIENVRTFDRSSSYPDVLVNCPFPMTPFYHAADCSLPVNKRHKSVQPIPNHQFRDFMKAGYAMLIMVKFHNIRLKDRFTGCPYIPLYQCDKEISEDTSVDNGRVLQAETIKLTMTDIDWRIIEDQYDFDSYEILDCWWSKYGYLPDKFRELVKMYYTQKTKLKGMDSVWYEKYKALLNSLYGLLAMDPCKSRITFNVLDQSIAKDVDVSFWEDDSFPGMNDYGEDRPDPNRRIFLFDEIWRKTHNNEESPADVRAAKLKEFEADLWNWELKTLNENTRHSLLVYQWGIWCCAWARYRLHQGTSLVDGPASPFNDFKPNYAFCYCDTDSVKFLMDADVNFDKFNAAAIEASRKNGLYATDKNGVVHYGGVFEEEEPYIRAVFHGAKKYAYEQYNEKKGFVETHITIAGANKEKGGKELEKRGGITALKPGFVFKEAGGTGLIYNDNTNVDLIIDGHQLHIGSNVVIVDSTYELGYGSTYSALLHDINDALGELSDLTGRAADQYLINLWPHYDDIDKSMQL